MQVSNKPAVSEASVVSPIRHESVHVTIPSPDWTSSDYPLGPSRVRFDPPLRRPLEVRQPVDYVIQEEKPSGAKRAVMLCGVAGMFASVGGGITALSFIGLPALPIIPAGIALSLGLICAGGRMR